MTEWLSSLTDRFNLFQLLSCLGHDPFVSRLGFFFCAIQGAFIRTCLSFTEAQRFENKGRAAREPMVDTHPDC